MERLDYDDMATIIMHHPDLLDYFDIESIDKYYGMEAIVKKHPGLRKYLENRLHKKFDKVVTEQ